MSCFDNQTSIASIANASQRNSEGCGCNCENDGIVQILQRILNAQERVERFEEEEEFCDRATLGCCKKEKECNTRPLKLFSCGGDPLLMEFTLDGYTSTTDVFRIEKIDGCVCTFRCLAPNSDQSSCFPYVKTSDFFSIDMGCCCKILRCLEDTHVECL